MKKKLLFAILFAILALTSCNDDDESSKGMNNSEVMFNFSVNIPDAVVQTKNITITRYILEVYKTSDLSTRVKRVEQAGSNFVFTLNANTNYTCLLWADGVAVDNNTNGTYNALDLKNVTLNTGKDMTEAFFARLEITDATTTINVSLKRATAKVNMVTPGTVNANTDLQVTYNRYNSFNTFTSEITGTPVETSINFNSAVTTGTLGTFMTFASVAGILTNFTALYNSAITNEMINTPIKANHITNIRGTYTNAAQDFTFVIVVDETWKHTIGWVEINVGSVANPNWIKVADRNADKNGRNGAAADKTAINYGYYYQWSNASNDATNVEKAYRACFDFSEGNGAWRLPTYTELQIIAGNGGNSHTVNANRKLKWDNTTTPTTWKLYDERVGQTANFIYFPMGGFIIGNSGASSNDVNGYAYYWSSTQLSNTNTSGLLTLHSTGDTYTTNSSSAIGGSVRCVK